MVIMIHGIIDYHDNLIVILINNNIDIVIIIMSNDIQ